MMEAHPMNGPEARLPYVIALAGGAFLWLAAAVASGKAEAWDSAIYWSVAYPLSIILAGVLGYRFPEKPWRWALAVMLAQAVMLVLSGGGFSMLPLGLILFAILALPGAGLAVIAARIRSRRPEA